MTASLALDDQVRTVAPACVQVDSLLRLPIDTVEPAELYGRGEPGEPETQSLESLGSSEPRGQQLCACSGRCHSPMRTPRELCHSFVSLLSSGGVSIEEVADLCGHSGTTVTETVYRHELRPMLLAGAAAMDGSSRSPVTSVGVSHSISHPDAKGATSFDRM